MVTETPGDSIVSVESFRETRENELTSLLPSQLDQQTLFSVLGTRREKPWSELKQGAS